jgi:hypothetical protein
MSPSHAEAIFLFPVTSFDAERGFPTPQANQSGIIQPVRWEAIALAPLFPRAS